MRDCAVSSVLGLCGLALLVGMTLAPDGDAERVAAVFAPWQDAGAVLAEIAALEAPIVRWGGLASIAVVDVAGDPALRAALGERALFLADPVAAGGCWRAP